MKCHTQGFQGTRPQAWCPLCLCENVRDSFKCRSESGGDGIDTELAAIADDIERYAQMLTKAVDTNNKRAAQSLLKMIASSARAGMKQQEPTMTKSQYKEAKKCLSQIVNENMAHTLKNPQAVAKALRKAADKLSRLGGGSARFIAHTLLPAAADMIEELQQNIGRMEGEERQARRGGKFPE